MCLLRNVDNKREGFRLILLKLMAKTKRKGRDDRCSAFLNQNQLVKFSEMRLRFLFFT
jgi:hypothetical protein